MTEPSGLEHINKIKLENINLGKENLSKAFDKIDEIENDNINTNNINNLKTFDNISKINEVSKNSKILNIELISSLFEPKGLILKIGPLGYEKSLREEKDGITYFGYEELQDTEKVFNYIFFIIFIFYKI